MPSFWQNLTLSASPPCSPQMPTFRLGLVLRPCSTPQRISRPTPLVSRDWKGSAAKTPAFFRPRSPEGSGPHRRGKDPWWFASVRGRRERFVIDVQLLGADDATLAPAARDHCGLAGFATRGRQDAPRHRHAAHTSPGLVSRRTRMTFSPRSAHSSALGAENTTRPAAAPGTTLMPVARTLNAREFRFSLESMTG